VADHIANRDRIIDLLRRELVGPSPVGHPLNITPIPTFSSKEEARRPHFQQTNGDEILQFSPPSVRYGIGVLFPQSTPFDKASEQDDTKDETIDLGSVEDGSRFESLTTSLGGGDDIPETSADEGQIDGDEFTLLGSSSYRPSTLGITFLARLEAGAQVVLEASGGRYTKFPVIIEGKEEGWWARTAISLRTEYRFNPAEWQTARIIEPSSVSEIDLAPLELQFQLFSRPYRGEQNTYLVTAVLRNLGTRTGDEHCLFQASFKVHILPGESGRAEILGYPEPEWSDSDIESASLNLLYRDHLTYAVGHGCAVERPNSDRGPVRTLIATSLPVYEAPSITPEITRADGSSIEVPMAQLAGVTDGNWRSSLLEIIEGYRKWIDQRREESRSLPTKHHAAADHNLRQCLRALDRMERGLAILEEDPTALLAFQLANHAVLLQRRRSQRITRTAHYSGKVTFAGEYVTPEASENDGPPANWRPFQIAFILAAIPSVTIATDIDRDTVDLIWFPTGGGKTEAYLGLAAYSIFLRRLRNPSDTGVNVLMRYTLRLLTAQQFQRASALICAMEYLRRSHVGMLGNTPFSIGVWLGSASTPNSHEDAKQTLRRLKRGQGNPQNKFLVTRCPWCGAIMGPVNLHHQKAPKVLGYEEARSTVRFFCPDNQCFFHGGLPIHVIDEDVYQHRPDLVIGTVDKFARLTWTDRPRALFGIDDAGNRIASPPNLILQDELHLISGPIGSMVGLYEPILEELCTDYRSTPPLKPKIVGSTATIRGYERQVRDLYGRTNTLLFPPPGISAQDSYFAQVAREADGTPKRGKKYIGVFGTSLGSLQTAQVRVFATLLQAPIALQLDPESSDPWWTLLSFFNSIRELGTSQTLLQSDIQDYLGAICDRLGIPRKQVRRTYSIRELTSRIRADEVPEAISALEVTTTSDQKPVDVCLASNIIEVGVDIDRLSLMTVVGQPKTTAQYIQVTGRVGRLWEERPGLVAMLYSPTKPRDRSHFERFWNYHERLYAQVEPTSVTPFSETALERALHAAIVAYVRQAGPVGEVQRPSPYPEKLVERAAGILRNRMEVVAPAESHTFERILAARIEEWRRWKPTEWVSSQTSEEIGLLHYAGEYARKEVKDRSWATPNSLRHVDATCEVSIVFAPA
jgi:hypothetical protein